MKKALLFFLASMISFAISAQVSDFSGNWKLNSSKSKINEQFSMAPGLITIVQSGNDMSVEKHTEFQGQEMVFTDKYTLDGKECVNPGFMDTQKKSVLSWDNDTKTLKVVSKIVMNDGNEININEIYKIDESGMVIESSSTSSFGDMSETMIYDKV
jgi:hypothetical protein